MKPVLLLDNKKYEDICPSTHNMECPIVKRTEYQLLDVDDEGFVTLMDDAGETRDDLRATDEEVAKQIRALCVTMAGTLVFAFVYVFAMRSVAAKAFVSKFS